MIDLYKDMLRAVEDLGTCPYTTEAFSELLSKVQAAVRAIICFIVFSMSDLYVRRLIA